MGDALFCVVGDALFCSKRARDECCCLFVEGDTVGDEGRIMSEPGKPQWLEQAGAEELKRIHQEQQELEKIREYSAELKKYEKRLNELRPQLSELEGKICQISREQY